MSYDFEHYIGGHLNRPGNRQDVETQKAYFADLVKAAGNANSAMQSQLKSTFGEVVVRGGQGNPWAFVKILFDKVAHQCADEVEAKWTDRLGGVDIFTFDHCWKITEHQRID